MGLIFLRVVPLKGYTTLFPLWYQYGQFLSIFWLSAAPTLGFFGGLSSGSASEKARPLRGVSQITGRIHERVETTLTKIYRDRQARVSGVLRFWKNLDSRLFGF